MNASIIPDMLCACRSHWTTYMSGIDAKTAFSNKIKHPAMYHIYRADMVANITAAFLVLPSALHTVQHRHFCFRNVLTKSIAGLAPQ